MTALKPLDLIKLTRAGLVNVAPRKTGGSERQGGPAGVLKITMGTRPVLQGGLHWPGCCERKELIYLLSTRRRQRASANPVHVRERRISLWWPEVCFLGVEGMFVVLGEGTAGGRADDGSKRFGEVVTLMGGEAVEQIVTNITLTEACWARRRWLESSRPQVLRVCRRNTENFFSLIESNFFFPGQSSC